MNEFSKYLQQLGREKQTESVRTSDRKGDRFGDSLTVVSSNITIEKYISHLKLLPDNLVESMKQKGFAMVLGTGTLAEVIVRYPKHKQFLEQFLIRHNQFSQKDNVCGVYLPQIKTTFITDKEGVSPFGFGDYGIEKSGSVILHEYGHGVGDLFGLDNDTRASEAHQRLFRKLRTHIRQKGPGDLTGVQELIADSFADYFLSKELCKRYPSLARDTFAQSYDAKWFDVLKEYIDKVR